MPFNFFTGMKKHTHSLKVKITIDILSYKVETKKPREILKKHVKKLQILKLIFSNSYKRKNSCL